MKELQEAILLRCNLPRSKQELTVKPPARAESSAFYSIGIVAGGINFDRLQKIG